MLIVDLCEGIVARLYGCPQLDELLFPLLGHLADLLVRLTLFFQQRALLFDQSVLLGKIIFVLLHNGVLLKQLIFQLLHFITQFVDTLHSVTVLLLPQSRFHV